MTKQTEFSLSDYSDEARFSFRQLKQFFTHEMTKQTEFSLSDSSDEARFSFRQLKQFFLMR